MAQNLLIDSRDVRFVLFEMLETDKLGARYPRFADFDRDVYEEILTLAERIAVDQIYPAAEEGDRIGCIHDPDTKEVRIPPSYKPALDAYYEAGFIGVGDSPEVGGMGMPYEINISTYEYFLAASVPLLMYPGLSHGAMNLIAAFGDDQLKKLFLEKMMSGEWGGTMCLTEAEAGSDVGALKSRAVKQADGTYLITGQNIFISSGDNDYYDNMVHLKLARIEGDPEGTKGLSIFVVPKYRVNADGTKGEFNDVACVGIEHKMGIKGSSTCTLSFGDNNTCQGYLLGGERQGIRIMFHMMNEERIGVGLMGLALSSTAYMHAVTYARNRIQGKHVSQMLNPEAKSVPIMEHPDIKRTLLWMKSYIEGMRMLTYFLTRNQTLEAVADGEEKEEASALGELLRPIVKAGNTDMGVLITSEAVQVYGGYGYCSDYPVERFMRDAKITTIYEGTNGIQSMDLVMRKILMNRDQHFYGVFKKRVESTIAVARGIVEDKYCKILERGLGDLDRVIEKMKGQMGQGKFLHLFAGATPLQQAMFMLVMAWLHLWSLTLTLPRMQELMGARKGEEREAFLRDNDEAAYYSGKVLSSQFYIGSEFPKYFGRIESLLSDESSVIKVSDAVFTGSPKE